ncbi:hypothetical protein PPL_00420 [Heterostelium album PN500]|uniref:Succinate dehydrogenase assembly factor 4, mitochondrial n=1 Tax=Heterostelium pallidum (strain ATCC 26659 / Pp 5 / PN500) TaxID=670386 RepID=D3AWE6_HETP5|nr:hypothetical protein PPL_00420 [Heterostelium album PN500]EFA86619.1 hypothetical protein PPL_00420 [Heterostelium album PN500]|eukprot:XP_020438724.1 hypothetical protein PPL_00420 [Heterostelium album PN500]
MISRCFRANLLAYNAKQLQIARFYVQNNNSGNTSQQDLEESMSEEKRRLMEELEELEAQYSKEHVNEKTGEIGGPKGPEPTRFGDWERKGRTSDF